MAPTQDSSGLGSDQLLTPFFRDVDIPLSDEMEGARLLKKRVGLPAAAPSAKRTKNHNDLEEEALDRYECRYQHLLGRAMGILLQNYGRPANVNLWARRLANSFMAVEADLVRGANLDDLEHRVKDHIKMQLVGGYTVPTSLIGSKCEADRSDAWHLQAWLAPIHAVENRDMIKTIKGYTEGAQ
jgi:hypothetical protein